jgi:hypothetical protein
MCYSKPQILRTDEAVHSIQSVSLPDSQKPMWTVLDNAGTVFTTANAYEADE